MRQLNVEQTARLEDIVICLCELLWENEIELSEEDGKALEKMISKYM